MRASPTAALALAGTGLLLAGCGGTRQDAHEPKATYVMRVAHASFPLRQVIARPTTMALSVRNLGAQTVPNVAVTVDSFNYTSTFPGLSANKRPAWAIERGPGAIARPPVESQEVIQPGSAQTAYVNTWALGPLPGGQLRTFLWRVVPLKPGLHVVHFSFHAGLSGKARAVRPLGGPVAGSFIVHVAPMPPATYVNPNTGRVVEGKAPTSP